MKYSQRRMAPYYLSNPAQALHRVLRPKLFRLGRMDWMSLVLLAGALVLAHVTAQWLTRNTTWRLVWVCVCWGLIMAHDWRTVTPATKAVGAAFAVGTAVWAVRIWQDRQEQP